MSYKRLLLVEGVDDQNVIDHILYNYKILCKQIKNSKDAQLLNDNTIAIKQTGGFDSLLEQFKIHLDDPDIKQIAIVVDADTDINARWQSICNVLKPSVFPPSPNPTGTIARLPQIGRELSVGAWVMPNNQQAGILEDFLHQLIPQGDDLWSYALECVDGIDKKLQRFTHLKLSKAQIHTWLAWQEEPGKPFGVAIRSNYLNVKNNNTHLFAKWIQSVFEL